MSSPAVIAVAGPCGSGKTTWINQSLKDATAPLSYFYSGLGRNPVDLMRIGYCFPSVQVMSDLPAPQVFSSLPDGAIIYVELDFPELFKPLLPKVRFCHQVAVIPPHLQDSAWHQWADQIIPGNDIAIPDAAKPPERWHAPLQGQVFDPASLEVVLTELMEGAYGDIHRVKGIFEMPDGQALYIDFVAGLEGVEYTELSIPRWLEGRPDRWSGMEVMGNNLQPKIISQTLLDGCLADEVIAYYQQQYQALSPV
ncbi:GTP-binding protein [Acaryochloris sp. 'Moss Beach']|uniref:GTP-binding protein n=1 Tax=Acaryochloris sp. 'Moss Beach' TaxID=2740837 RepID=UPI001F37DF12|nr:GTP-binding protein [Acaryochloris sp. 'Moss Beach']UJB71656.1 GTP-binding protein [Acaryochloris sp. 'Moss Beach']